MKYKWISNCLQLLDVLNRELFLNGIKMKYKWISSITLKQQCWLLSKKIEYTFEVIKNDIQNRMYPKTSNSSYSRFMCI